MYSTQNIVNDLMELGVKQGDLLIVHASYKKIGNVDGGPETVVKALIKAVEKNGTVMVPTFTYSYSGIWNVTPFNVKNTPGRGNGIISETIRKMPGARRSPHPTYSVACIGELAELLTDISETGSPLGKESSYQLALQNNAKILLLGVGNNTNSMIHTAEVLAELPYNHIHFRKFWGKYALVERQTGKVEKIKLPEEFPACSAGFDKVDHFVKDENLARERRVGDVPCYLIDSKGFVKALLKKLKKEPAWLLCNNIVCEPCSLRKKELKKRGIMQ